MRPSEAEQKQAEIIRKMSGEKRLKIAFELTHLTRKMMEAGIRSQYPHISPQEFKKQAAIRSGQ